MTLQEANKEFVKKFYDEVFLGKDVTNLADYMREDYRQHSFGVADGRAGFIEFTKHFFQQPYTMDIKHLMADGDIVLIHFHFHDPANPADRGADVMDMYRIQDGKLAEHWDVISVIPEKMAHNNTAF